MNKILLSLLTISLVAVVAVGATRAYFSDTETSLGNSFTAGTLDFEIKDPVASGHQVFSIPNMKPGDVVTKYIVVTNEGSLDMKWKAWLTETGSEILDDVLKVQWTIHPTGYTGYTALTTAGYTIAGPVDGLIGGYTAISTLSSSNPMLWDSTTAVAFETKWAAVYKVDVKMDEAATNTYQGAKYTGDLNFYATQWEKIGWE